MSKIINHIPDALLVIGTTLILQPWSFSVNQPCFNQILDVCGYKLDFDIKEIGMIITALGISLLLKQMLSSISNFYCKKKGMPIE